MAAPAPVVGAATRVQQNVILSLCAFAQMGAIAALRESQTFTAEIIREFQPKAQTRLRRLRSDYEASNCKTILAGLFTSFRK